MKRKKDRSPESMRQFKILISIVFVLAIVLAIFIENIGKRLSTWDVFRYSGMASQETPKYIYLKEVDRYFGVYGAYTEEAIDSMIHYYRHAHPSDSMPNYSAHQYIYVTPFTKFEVLETLPEDSLVVLRRYVNSNRMVRERVLFVPSFCVHDRVPVLPK